MLIHPFCIRPGSFEHPSFPLCRFFFFQDSVPSQKAEIRPTGSFFLFSTAFLFQLFFACCPRVHTSSLSPPQEAPPSVVWIPSQLTPLAPSSLFPPYVPPLFLLSLEEGPPRASFGGALSHSASFLTPLHNPFLFELAWSLGCAQGFFRRMRSFVLFASPLDRKFLAGTSAAESPHASTPPPSCRPSTMSGPVVCYFIIESDPSKKPMRLLVVGPTTKFHARTSVVCSPLAGSRFPAARYSDVREPFRKMILPTACLVASSTVQSLCCWLQLGRHPQLYLMPPPW